MKKMNTFKEFLILTLGTLIISVSVYFFMMPCNLTIGSASALAMVLSNYLPLSVSVLNLLLNIFLLITSFLLVGKDFGIKTVYCSILMPVIMGVFEILFPNQPSLTQDPFLDGICYILVVGLGIAILFSRNASTGGIEIVAKILNKFFRTDFGKAMSVSGILVASTALLVYDKTVAVVSILCTYFGGLLVDHFIFGMNAKRRVCILSQKQEEIVDYILHTLHSGATIYEAIGAYNNVKRKEIVAIVNKQEYARLMEYLASTDPRAFVTVIAVNEVNYQPKTNT